MQATRHCRNNQHSVARGRWCHYRDRRHLDWESKGFIYLAVVLDWFSRRVLSWKLSITMETSFCIETLEEALAKHGTPKIFNTDQGSQFSISSAADLRLLEEECRQERHFQAHRSRSMVEFSDHGRPQPKPEPAIQRFPSS